MLISTNNILVRKWWAIFVVINLFLIACTIVHPHLPDFSQKWRLISPFSLHGENSIAVWWSGITLLLAALICFDRYRSNNESNKLSWLLLSFVMAGLSLDEIGSLHERISIVSGWSGLLPFAIIIFSLLAYTLISLYKNKSSRLNAIYILIAFALYGSVALQEFIEHLLKWPPWSAGLRVGIEEGCELLGTFLIIYSALYQNENKPNKHIYALRPAFETLLTLKYFVMAGLVLHVIGSYLYIQLNSQDLRGNPMTWYPAVCYFCSFLVCSWYSERTETSGNIIGWRILLFACLLSSISVMSNLFIIALPGINNFISTDLIEEKFVLFYLLQLIMAGVFIFKLLKTKGSLTLIIGLAIISGLAFISILQEDIWFRYSVLGVCSCYVYLLALRTCNPEILEKVSNKLSHR